MFQFLKAVGNSFPKDYELNSGCKFIQVKGFIGILLLDNFYFWYCDKNGIKYEKPEYDM